MKGKILLFYNPSSGDGLFVNNLDKIIERCQAEGYIVIALRADEKNYLCDLMKKISSSDYQNEYRLIIAVGGDGTINVCVNTMISEGVDLPIAILPMGTANDFAGYFELPVDIDEMLDIAFSGHYTNVDVGKVNDRYFVNVCAIGKVVDISQKIDQTWKNVFGVVAYYAKSISDIPRLKPISVVLRNGEDVYKEKMYFMLIMNGRAARGFKKVSPESDITDGKLDVILIRSTKFIKTPSLLLKILKGKIMEENNVLSFKTTDLTVECNANVETDIDGEQGSAFPLRFSVLHNKLRICSPALMGGSKEVKIDKGNITLKRTDEYDMLVDFFIDNGLEFSEEEQVATEVIDCYKAVLEDGELIGGVVLAKREGAYIIDGIAVKEEYRKFGVGRMMVDKALEVSRQLGENTIYLIARAPGFFRRLDFVNIDKDEAPTFYECAECPQFGKTCFPELMKYEIK